MTSEMTIGNNLMRYCEGGVAGRIAEINPVVNKTAGAQQVAAAASGLGFAPAVATRIFRAGCVHPGGLGLQRVDQLHDAQEIQKTPKLPLKM